MLKEVIEQLEEEMLEYHNAITEEYDRQTQESPFFDENKPLRPFPDEDTDSTEFPNIDELVQRIQYPNLDEIFPTNRVDLEQLLANPTLEATLS